VYRLVGGQVPPGEIALTLVAVAVSAGALATILALAAGPNLRNADRAAADHPVPVDRRPEVHVNTRTTAEMLPPNVARNQPVDDAPRE
jgi:hypothetical protein